MVNERLSGPAEGVSDGPPDGPRFASATLALTRPAAVVARGGALTRPCPVPRSAGVYAWYFRAPLAAVPLEGWTRLASRFHPRSRPRDGRLWQAGGRERPRLREAFCELNETAIGVAIAATKKIIG